VASLPLNDKGYPVPWFVAWIDGVPDFRVIGDGKLSRAVHDHLCWICGERLGRHLIFVAGPMCGINRTSGEPPCHHDCATYAATACPFMTLPKAHRRDAALPMNGRMREGHIDRNPGVAMLWTTLDYRPFRTPRGDLLFTMGEPEKVEWYAQGRPATHGEVLESISTGLPALEEMAAAQGPSAEHHLRTLVERFQQWIPT
jgi:hypothetical protein